MTVEEYIQKRKEYRLVGEYSVRKPIYIHGTFRLTEALEAFKQFGEVLFIQECMKGRKVTVWNRQGQWGKLEQNLKQNG